MVLSAVLAEFEKLVSFLLRGRRRMYSWALELVSLVKIGQEVEYCLCKCPIFEALRKTQERR
jgi:hypothetical protein